MPPEVREGLRKWFREYAAWLSSDPMALCDYGKEQNHGLSYHVQLIAYARYCGDEAAARKNLEMMRSLVVKAVDKQGFLPAEVVRTRSWHYSAYALRMVMRAVGRFLPGGDRRRNPGAGGALRTLHRRAGRCGPAAPPALPVPDRRGRFLPPGGSAAPAADPP